MKVEFVDGKYQTNLGTREISCVPPVGATVVLTFPTLGSVYFKVTKAVWEFGVGEIVRLTVEME